MTDYDANDPKCQAGVEAAADWLKNDRDDGAAMQKWMRDGEGQMTMASALADDMRAALLPRPKTPREVWEEYVKDEPDVDSYVECLRMGGRTWAAGLLRDLAEAFEREQNGETNG